MVLNRNSWHQISCHMDNAHCLGEKKASYFNRVLVKRVESNTETWDKAQMCMCEEVHGMCHSISKVGGKCESSHLPFHCAWTRRLTGALLEHIQA